VPAFLRSNQVIPLPLETRGLTRERGNKWHSVGLPKSSLLLKSFGGLGTVPGVKRYTVHWGKAKGGGITPLLYLSGVSRSVVNYGGVRTLLNVAVVNSVLKHWHTIA